MRVLTFHLPDLGEGLREAEIVAWHVSVGDAVRSGEPLLSVETDKAVMDIPSPRTAKIVALHGKPGDRVDVGAALVDFEVADAGAVVGQLAQPAKDTPTEGRKQVPGAAPAPARVRATPKARRRAKALGVRIDRVKPEGSVIQVADVNAAASAANAGPDAAAEPGPDAGAAPSGGTAVRPLTGVRRSMALRMAEAHARVVPASVTDEADISAWTADQRPMPRLIRAIVRGCAAVPTLNALFNDGELTLSPCRTVDLGIAMETADGLFVPVLRDAGALDPEEIARRVNDLEQNVRDRSIPGDMLRGQSITLSNFGAVAGLHAQMVVVPPQVAILGAGRIFSRLTLDQGVPGTARILPLSLTFDHRAATGLEACRFLAATIEDLETPD